jgi:hypothetical protein
MSNSFTIGTRLRSTGGLTIELGIMTALMSACAPSRCPADFAQPVFRVQEQPFERISREVPTFGGFFYEGERLVAYVTALEDSEAVRVAIEPEISRLRAFLREPPINRSDIVVRQGTYSFVQLRDWRNAFANGCWIPDVASLDLDEAANKLTIGLVTGSGRGEVEQKLSELGVPPAAFKLVIVGEFRPEATLRNNRDSSG